MSERPSAPWYRRRTPWIVTCIVALVVVAVRVGLDPVATWWTQRGLDRMQGFRGSFSDVSFSLLALSYSIDDLEIVEAEQQETPPDEPLFYAERIEARVLWRELLHGTVVGRADVRNAKASIVLLPGEEQKERLAKQAAEAAVSERDAPFELDEALAAIVPFRVDRLDVFDGEVLVVDATVPERSRLWISRIEASLENFTSRRELSAGEPTTLALSSRLQDSGQLGLFVTAEPLAERATFAAEMRVVGLELRDLHDWIRAEADLEVRRGALDLFASIRCDDGRLSGGVKPLLKDVEVGPEDGDLGTRLRAALADASLDVFSDRVPGREAAATVVPIEGSITAPQAELWPTVLGVLRNAFVEALAAGFADVAEAG